MAKLTKVENLLADIDDLRAQLNAKLDDAESALGDNPLALLDAYKTAQGYHDATMFVSEELIDAMKAIETDTPSPNHVWLVVGPYQWNIWHRWSDALEAIGRDWRFVKFVRMDLTKAKYSLVDEMGGIRIAPMVEVLEYHIATQELNRPKVPKR